MVRGSLRITRRETRRLGDEGGRGWVVATVRRRVAGGFVGGQSIGQPAERVVRDFVGKLVVRFVGRLTAPSVRSESLRGATTFAASRSCVPARRARSVGARGPNAALRWRRGAVAGTIVE